MGDTAIEWATMVWNPTTGCDRVSPGCDNCYALTMAKRLKGMGSAKYQHDGDPRTSGPGFGLTVHPQTLSDPLGWRKSERVFVNSMSDLGHGDVPFEFLDAVWETMAQTPRHTYMILTKRPARLRSFLRHRSQVLPNVWLGTSTENQHWADIRIPALLETPAAVRFISAEPLLGPIDLTHMDVERHASTMYQINALTGRNTDMGRPCEDVASLDWAIVGGESGAGARRMDPDWARSLRDQCEKASVAFLFKQAGSVLAREWGGKGKGGDPEGWPEPFPRQYPQAS